VKSTLDRYPTNRRSSVCRACPNVTSVSSSAAATWDALAGEFRRQTPTTSAGSVSVVDISRLEFGSDQKTA
jgi:hypothetical protein